MHVFFMVQEAFYNDHLVFGGVMSITTVLWDVDGTLLDFQYSQRCALEKCFTDFGLSFDDEIYRLYDSINESYWKRLELGEITKDELLTGRFETLFGVLNINKIILQEFLSDYQKALGIYYAYLDNSLEIVTALKGKVAQYIVTNGVSQTQINKLRLSGIAAFMEEIFVSENVGALKPNPEFFEYCFEHIEEKDKNNILIVGDSLSSDIKGGVLAGIKTCWYKKDNETNNTEFQPDYEILHLDEVLSLIIKSREIKG